ncbi:NAD(P)-dependent dehydrogenase (short-subunit alcohol dehydrogenase family) [Planomicrobium koreense]|uniref:NAD(P)-dependent dehydrogenase (Short-subunit alcohol dehydrogenase family) n=1 Tax=Planococcus koreensis TaxID=112331 RepID=A0A7W8CV44_9BACL|nr:short-chain dehydrogenase [Planococcus koreensis]MBB5180964.1 NAD(P)-dependent dehydrogenase (short-subunit alcohol dehydrogenase family) [Planococcus koreensis]
MKHALVIGGTGMLAQASVWLSENGYHVSVIGRNPGKIQQLLEQNPTQLTPVLVNYTNTEELAEKIRCNQQKNGPIELVVAWVHSTGPQVIPCVLEMLPAIQPVEFFHVNGSSSNLKDIKARTALTKHVFYHQIQLGFKIENGISRWLTHEEISQGAIEAVLSGKSESVIGTLEPWDKRP